MGIDGVMYAGPIADGAALLAAVICAVRELQKMKALERESTDEGTNADRVHD